MKEIIDSLTPLVDVCEKIKKQQDDGCIKYLLDCHLDARMRAGGEAFSEYPNDDINETYEAIIDYGKLLQSECVELAEQHKKLASVLGYNTKTVEIDESEFMTRLYGPDDVLITDFPGEADLTNFWPELPTLEKLLEMIAGKMKTIDKPEKSPGTISENAKKFADSHVEDAVLLGNTGVGCQSQSQTMSQIAIAINLGRIADFLDRMSWDCNDNPIIGCEVTNMQ